MGVRQKLKRQAESGPVCPASPPFIHVTPPGTPFHVHRVRCLAHAASHVTDLCEIGGRFVARFWNLPSDQSCSG